MNLLKRLYSKEEREKDAISHALAKYARKDQLTIEAQNTLQAWFDKDPDNLALAELLRKGEEARDILDADPEGMKKMWAEQDRKLREMGIGYDPKTLWQRLLFWKRN